MLSVNFLVTAKWTENTILPMRWHHFTKNSVFDLGNLMWNGWSFVWITVHFTRALPLNDSCGILGWFAYHIPHIPRVLRPVTFTCSARWRIDWSGSRLRARTNFLNNCTKWYSRSQSKNWSESSQLGSIEFAKWVKKLATALLSKSFAVYSLRSRLLFVSRAFPFRSDCAIWFLWFCPFFSKQIVVTSHRSNSQKLMAHRSQCFQCYAKFPTRLFFTKFVTSTKSLKIVQVHLRQIS
jgi:hypothetical protein